MVIDGWQRRPRGALASRREAKAAPRSATPASSVTRPSPDTAPRAYGLPARLWRSGTAAASELRSQKADHGATIRINPASRKYAANSSRVAKEMISLGFHAGEPLDALRDVAVVTRFRLQLQKYGQRPRRVPAFLHHGAEIVQQCAAVFFAGSRGFGRALEPFDGARRVAAVLEDAPEQRRGLETEPRRPRGDFERADGLVRQSHLEVGPGERHVLRRLVGSPRTVRVRVGGRDVRGFGRPRRRNRLRLWRRS